ncbi:uncharacterized protein LOC106398800 [Brassica napus]|uniref:uncharacterized protein LOC106398800 n=1 Tax=Brassica napus TaxID=3708 RepID=UPI0006AA95BB|nr:uncharacterized protein LOC106398800 [Brassica napus]
MALANGMKPVILMLVVQMALAGVNIFFKLAISSAVSVPVLLAYRFLLSTAVMVPLAFFFNRQCDINLLPGSSTGHVTFLASNHRVLGACLALISCFSYAIWIIIQAKMSETFQCHYASTGLMSLMAFFQSTIYALYVERDWTQ